MNLTNIELSYKVKKQHQPVLPLIPSVFPIPSKLHTKNHPFSYHLAWLCPRPISNSQLHVLPHFHLCPIYLVVFKGSY